MDFEESGSESFDISTLISNSVRKPVLSSMLILIASVFWHKISANKSILYQIIWLKVGLTIKKKDIKIGEVQFHQLLRPLLDLKKKHGPVNL